MRPLVALLLAVMLLTGCQHAVVGAPAMGPRDVNPAYFFAGDVPTYGQRVNPNDAIALAYMRAMRRIDP